MSTHTITSTGAQDLTLKINGLKLSDATQDCHGTLTILECEGDDWVQVHFVGVDGSYRIDHADIDMDGWFDVNEAEVSE